MSFMANRTTNVVDGMKNLLQITYYLLLLGRPQHGQDYRSRISEAR